MRHSEESRNRGYVAMRHGIAKRLDVAVLQVLDKRRPRVEAGFARDGKLRIRELKRTRDAGIRANGFHAGKSRGIAGLGVAQQILGELVLLFEIDGNAQTLFRHGRPPSTIARVRIMGRRKVA